MLLWKSEETSLRSCGHICTDLGIPKAGDTEEKEKLKKLLKWGKWQIAKFSHTSKIRNSLSCNVDFELILLIEFQSKANIEIIGF